MEKKMNVQGKKPVTLAVKSSGTESKPKFQKPDYREQLKSFKSQLKEKKKVEPKKPTVKQVAIDIEPETFNYTKSEPLLKDGWAVFKSVNGQLMAMPEEMLQTEAKEAPKGDKRKTHKSGPRYFPFEFVKGTLYLVDKPGKPKYAYFHDYKFSEFLKRYGIDRIIRKNAEGEYQGRTETVKNTANVFSFITDGEWTTHETSQLRMDEEPIVQMLQSNTYVNVTGATFALVEQVAYRTDDAQDVEPFVRRFLVTDYDIYAMEEEIANAVRYLNGEAEVTAEEQ